MFLSLRLLKELVFFHLLSMANKHIQTHIQTGKLNHYGIRREDFNWFKNNSVYYHQDLKFELLKMEYLKSSSYGLISYIQNLLRSINKKLTTFLMMQINCMQVVLSMLTRKLFLICQI